MLVLLVLPFWISYIMRMFAWTNLLATDGYAARALNALSIDSLFGALGLMEGSDWLGGQPITVILALVYGYVPFLIIPLYASLDRLDSRLVEAARDLGASPVESFRRVILPATMPGIVAGLVIIALPMFGDFFTQDLMSGSPNTSMIGNAINAAVQGGPDKSLGAALTMLLSAFLLVFMGFYLRSVRREQRQGSAMRRDPWGRPRVLAAVTWIYIVWSLVPVLLAIRFAFNEGRSRSVSQGFSFRWFWEDPTLSVFEDPTLRAALEQSLTLAGPGDADRDAARHRARARPAALARSGLGHREPADAAAAGDPGAGVRRRPVPALHDRVLVRRARHDRAGIGHVTFSISFVVVIVRGRLQTIGPDMEEAAADLGAPPWEVLRRVLLPLLAPAVAASLLIVFALSIDDFVVSQYLAVGRRHDHGADADLRAGARGADPGAERAGDADAARDAAGARARVRRVPRRRRAASAAARPPSGSSPPSRPPSTQEVRSERRDPRRRR